MEDTSLSLSLIIPHTVPETVLLVADKTKALGIKTCKATKLAVVQPEARVNHQVDALPATQGSL